MGTITLMQNKFLNLTQGLCDDTQFEQIELVSQTATLTWFIGGAFYRYRYLQNIGTNKNVIWDGLLKSKIAVYGALILLHCIYIYYKSMQFIQCQLPAYFLVAEIVFLLSLIVALWIMTREVSVRLSECWYVHKMFFALNIASGICMLVSYQKATSWQEYLNGINLSLFLFLGLLQHMTINRNSKKQRQLQDPLLETTMSNKARMTILKEKEEDDRRRTLMLHKENRNEQLKLNSIGLQIKFSSMKVREGERVYLFTTRISNLPKQHMEEDPNKTAINMSMQSDLRNYQPRDLNSTQNIARGETMATASNYENDSVWIQNDRPSTLEFKDVRRKQIEIEQLFGLAGVDHANNKEQVLINLKDLQAFVDQLIKFQELWTEEFLKIFGVSDNEVLKMMFRQREMTLMDKKVKRIDKVKVGTQEVQSKFAQTQAIGEQDWEGQSNGSDQGFMSGLIGDESQVDFKVQNQRPIFGQDYEEFEGFNQGGKDQFEARNDFDLEGEQDDGFPALI